MVYLAVERLQGDVSLSLAPPQPTRPVLQDSKAKGQSSGVGPFLTVRHRHLRRYRGCPFLNPVLDRSPEKIVTRLSPFSVVWS